jgi:hypothetical protein
MQFFLKKETPLPGSYNVHLSTFIHDMNKKPNSYRFKGDGRRHEPVTTLTVSKGDYLLPGKRFNLFKKLIYV